MTSSQVWRLHGRALPPPKIRPLLKHRRSRWRNLRLSKTNDAALHDVNHISSKSRYGWQLLVFLCGS